MIGASSDSKSEQSEGVPDISTHAIARNSLIIGVTRVIQVFVVLAYIAMISRYLGLARFGIYSVLWAAATFGVSLPDGGLNNILVRELARHKSDIARYLGAAVVVRWMFTLLLVFIGLIAVWVWHPARGGALAAIFALAWAALQLSISVNSAVFLAFERLEYEAIVSLTNMGTTLAATAVAIRADWGLAGVLGATAFTNLLAALIGSMLVVKRFGRAKVAIDWPLWRSYIHDAAPVGFSRMLTEFYFRLGVFFLSWLSTPANVALFNGAYRIVVQLNHVPSLVVPAAYPSFSRLAKSSTTTLAYAAQKCFKLLFLMALPVAVTLSFYSREVIVLLLGPKFEAASRSLALLGWATLTMFPSTLFWFLLVAVNRQKALATSLMTCVALNALVDWALIPRYGFVGACIGTLAAEATFFTLAYYHVRCTLGPLHIPQTVVRPLASAVVMASVLRATLHIPPIYSMAVGAFTYVATLFLLRVFEPDERAAVGRLLSRFGRRAR